MRKTIARLVIKDLIRGDGTKQELSLFKEKFSILEQKVSLKDSVISKLEFKLSNFSDISLTQSQQLNTSNELNKRLKQDLQKQKLKTKMFKYGGGAVILGALVLSLSN